ncbi:MAG: hypothetical protein L3K26_12570, partial [Candidatus Hydrogenedentes bacterium]|nr:hypothetical protein [Candidatus Hydrogenedentota bacterium]
RPTDSELLATLESPVNIEFEDIHVKDILEFIQDSFEVNVVLDQREVAPAPPRDEAQAKRRDTGEPREYVTDGHVPQLTLKNVPLKDALNALGRPLNLQGVAWGHTVWLTTLDRATKEKAFPMPRAAFEEGRILDVLKSPVNIEFEEIHIKDVMEFITASFELNLVLDNRVVMPEGGDWSKPPIGSPGYETDGLIRYINLKNMPLGEALHVITRLLDLSYTVEKDYVFISTHELLNLLK